MAQEQAMLGADGLDGRPCPLLSTTAAGRKCDHSEQRCYAGSATLVWGWLVPNGSPEWHVHGPVAGVGKKKERFGKQRATRREISKKKRQ